MVRHGVVFSRSITEFSWSLPARLPGKLLPINATAAAFVYIPVHGVAAIGKGGRTWQRRGLPKDSAVDYCPASIRKFQTIAPHDDRPHPSVKILGWYPQSHIHIYSNFHTTRAGRPSNLGVECRGLFHNVSRSLVKNMRITQIIWEFAPQR
jgi:hypothetical protein